jgi:hypothetical protein
MRRSENGIMISNRPMDRGIPDENESRLDELFRAYREACPDPEPSVNFIPEMWTKIEAREVSTNWFGRMAKGLVTAAVALSVLLGMLASTPNQAVEYFNATFVEALTAEHFASLEPLNVDHIAEIMEQ